MMKTNFKFLATILFVAAGFVSCVQDDDFDVPNTAPQEVTIPTNSIIEIAAVKGERDQQTFSRFDDETIVTFDDRTDLQTQFMSGYVISSDEAGTFFEEIILQDNPVNPTVGIRLLVDVNPLFSSYQIGQRLLIRLDGLSVGISNGVLTLGTRDNDRIAAISPALQDDVIIRTPEVTTIEPLEVDFATLTNESVNIQNPFLNLFIRVSDVQFTDDIVDNPDDDTDADDATTYAAEGTDNFDGERSLEQCVNGNPSGMLILSTSTFADFKGLTLPAGNGTIDGVFLNNFNGREYNLVVNTPEDVNLTAERCTPPPMVIGFFTEDFEATTIAQLESEGWTNQNVSGGTTEFTIENRNGNNFAEITAFRTSEANVDTYLVTPVINLDSTDGEELLFDIRQGFDNGSNFTVLLSTDFNGDASTATWTNLNANIPNGPASGFDDAFSPVDPIDLSGFSGDVYLAFFYEGADPGNTTTIQLDNVNVTGFQ